VAVAATILMVLLFLPGGGKTILQAPPAVPPEEWSTPGDPPALQMKHQGVPPGGSSAAAVSLPSLAARSLDLEAVTETIALGEDPAPLIEAILYSGGAVGDDLVAILLEGGMDDFEMYALDLVLKLAFKASLLDLPGEEDLFFDRQVALLLLADAWLEDPETYAVAGSVLTEVGILTVPDALVLVGLFGRSAGLDDSGRQRLKQILRSSLAANPQLAGEISSQWLVSSNPVLRHLALEAVVGSHPDDPQPILEAMASAEDQEVADLVAIACGYLSIDQAPKVLEQVASRIDANSGSDRAISIFIERAPQMDARELIYLAGDEEETVGFRRAVLRSLSGVENPQDGQPHWFGAVLDTLRTDPSSTVRRTALLQLSLFWPVEDVSGFLAEVRQSGADSGGRWALLNFERRLGAEEGSLAPGMREHLIEEMRRLGID